jgi:ribonuclease-3
MDLVRMLGFLPRKLALYKLAFLPKSALQKDASGIQLNNERLEYLGDAVLDAIVAHYLFNRFPEANEGVMSQLRARIVKRKTMDQLAVKIGIPSMMDPAISPVNSSKHIYGNALEAFIGAIYLDRGYETSRKFLEKKVLKKHIDLAQLVRKDPDHKSRIIEWAQKNKVEIIFESKEEHTSSGSSPSFVSSIYLNSKVQGSGRGGSKKEAEQQAAKATLKSIMHGSEET